MTETKYLINIIKMKPGFLTQIMVVPVTGMTLPDASLMAKKLGFKMLSHNGAVYSVEYLYHAANSSDAILFTLSDLVDYNYNA